MSGHGHVVPNADGSKARCGGPKMCAVCALEFAQLYATEGHVFPERLTLRDTKVIADEGQRIYTTATGFGYEKCEYVRADLAAPAALVSPPDNGGWMPIETAPKDGTQALGFVPSYFQGKGGQAVILWLNGRWMDGRAWEVSPTHWQPLPSPPALQSHNEGSAGK